VSAKTKRLVILGLFVPGVAGVLALACPRRGLRSIGPIAFVALVRNLLDPSQLMQSLLLGIISAFRVAGNLVPGGDDLPKKELVV
jgi:hypothetical protein